MLHFVTKNEYKSFIEVVLLTCGTIYSL